MHSGNETVIKYGQHHTIGNVKVFGSEEISNLYSIGRGSSEKGRCI